MIKTPNQGFLFVFFGVGDEQVGQVGVGWGVRAIILKSDTMFYPYTYCYKFSSRRSTLNQTRKSVHRTRMPPPNAIQKKGLYVTATGIP